MARFATTMAANAATRMLVKQMKLRSPDISVVLEPSMAAGEGAYIGITRAGTVLVHVRATDGEFAETIREALARLGGEILDEGTTRSTGGYGPTTGHGAKSVIGGAAVTSAMANHRYTQENASTHPPA
ncbi:MAG: hypothetical protein EPO26_02695 [Chloroflexota bacterium]|nr:MAG: hypothetical protein EPO26_02695 [Chloroflexota bacterium]